MEAIFLVRGAGGPQLKRNPLDGARAPQRLSTHMRRFSAKLLFQFRPARPSDRSSMALCEERIVTFGANSPRAALANAKQIARRASYSFPVVGGGRVNFELVGILELMELGVETVPGEVWWDLYHKRLPGRRRSSLIPPERSLRIFTDFGPGHSASRTRKHKATKAKARRLTSA